PRTPLGAFRVIPLTPRIPRQITRSRPITVAILTTSTAVEGKAPLRHAGPRDNLAHPSSTHMQRYLPAVALFGLLGTAPPCRLGAQTPITDSTVALLVDLIRANSSNPGGSTKLVADVLAP